MRRGRPVQSKIRQNIQDVLFITGEMYAYNVYKIYRELFPQCTMRSIYYHLKKGVTLNEFKISSVEKEKGDYSWGSIAEKTYYSLGENAHPSVNEKIRKYIENIKKN